MRKVDFEKKNLVFPIKKIPSLVLFSDTIMLQHRIIQFSFNYLSTGRLQEVKDKKTFKFLALKVVRVAYERWAVTRGFKYSDLT